MARLKNPVGASHPSPNPCEACSIGQDCCTHLSGLRVTEIEFARCFAAHADKLLIQREGTIYVITPKNGAACPNWENGGCAVYDARPRDCRLFPFTLFVRRRTDDGLSLGYHSDTRCPLKATLLASDHEARTIVRQFGNEALPGAAIEVTPETTLERLKRRARTSTYALLSRVRKRSLYRRRVGSA